VGVTDATRKATAWGALALALVAVVAMEAHGAAWSRQRGGEVRSLPHSVIATAGVVASVAAFVLFTVIVIGARGRETPDQRQKRWRNAIALLVFLAFIALIEAFAHPSHHTPVGRGPAPHVSARGAPSSGSGGHHTATTWWPLVIVGLAAAGVFAAASVRRSAGHTAVDGPGTDPAVAMVEASLDDLRSEPDARRAVVAAYARMEHGLAARGFAREPAETPTEYFQRALAAHDGVVVALSSEPLRELTALAERARFSTFAIDEPMRARAVAALESLRDELQRESLALMIGTSDPGDHAS
jgi:hypothetical protein